MLVAKAKELFGSPDKWNKDNIKELGNLVAGLLPSELKQIGEQVIKESLQALKEIEFHVDQVHVYIASHTCNSKENNSLKKEAFLAKTFLRIYCFVFCFN